MVNGKDSEATPLAIHTSILDKSHESPSNIYRGNDEEASKIISAPNCFKTETEKSPAGLPSQEINWDGPKDELNPMNWPSGKKWRTLGVISMMAFITLVFEVFSKINR